MRHEPYYERTSWEILSERDKNLCSLCGEPLEGRSWIHKVHDTLSGSVRACVECWSKIDAGDTKHPLYMKRPALRELPTDIPAPRSSRAKLTPKQVNEIRRLKSKYGSRLTNAELARRFNVTDVNIHNILTNKIYKLE